MTFGHPKDKLLIKNPENQWIRCEKENCIFWAHTACVGVKIDGIDANEITFFLSRTS